MHFYYEASAVSAVSAALTVESQLAAGAPGGQRPPHQRLQHPGCDPRSGVSVRSTPQKTAIHAANAVIMYMH